jgi:hypothetical protein
VVAVFGIAFAVLLTGNSASSGPGHHKPQALAAASPPGAATPTQLPSPTASKAPHKKSPSAVPSPVRISTPPVANQQANPGSGTVRLASTVSANSWNNSQGGGWVSFQVDNIGSAAAGQVTVTITLPAGASMAGGGDGGGGGGEASLSLFAGHAHWNCQPTATGATCTLAALAAGGKAAGGIFFTVSGGSICGQPVDLTAVSGSASSSAQSSIAC